MAKPFQKVAVDEPEIVEMVVVHGSVHDVSDTAIPVGEKCKLPSGHAKDLRAAGYVATEKEWKAMQKKAAAEAELAELRGEDEAPPPAPPGEEEPPTRESIAVDKLADEEKARAKKAKAKKAKAKK